MASKSAKKKKEQNDIRLRNLPPSLFSHIVTRADINKRTLPAQVEFMLEFAQKKGV